PVERDVAIGQAAQRAGCVYRDAVLLVALATEAVEVLEREADRVDQGVAAAAERVVGVLLHALAGGDGAHRRRQVGVVVGRWRRDLLAQQALANELAALGR